MNAKEFIKLVEEQKPESNDIAANTWHMMRRIANHYKTCPDCCDSFNDMEYDNLTLRDIAILMEENSEIEDWTCQ